MKKECECGRKVIVQKSERGSTQTPECATCKTYGVKESTRMFLEINRKREKTKFE